MGFRHVASRWAVALDQRSLFFARDCGIPDAVMARHRKLFEDIDMKYVGLTDDPVRRRTEHGNPSDWAQRSFTSEAEARQWEKAMIAQDGYTGGPGGQGWRYGYTYTITLSTTE